jgi:hypothetical protein
MIEAIQTPKADELIDYTEKTLLQIQQYLSLKTPLSSEFKDRVPKSNRKNIPDGSENLLTKGKIVKSARKYDNIDIPDNSLEPCWIAYSNTQTFLNRLKLNY